MHACIRRAKKKTLCTFGFYPKITSHTHAPTSFRHKYKFGVEPLINHQKIEPVQRTPKPSLFCLVLSVRPYFFSHHITSHTKQKTKTGTATAAARGKGKKRRRFHRQTQKHPHQRQRQQRERRHQEEWEEQGRYQGRV